MTVYKTSPADWLAPSLRPDVGGPSLIPPEVTPGYLGRHQVHPDLTHFSEVVQNARRFTHYNIKLPPIDQWGGVVRATATDAQVKVACLRYWVEVNRMRVSMIEQAGRRAILVPVLTRCQAMLPSSLFNMEFIKTHKVVRIPGFMDCLVLLKKYKKSSEIKAEEVTPEALAGYLMMFESMGRRLKGTCWVVEHPGYLGPVELCPEHDCIIKSVLET